jgi:hypothetical protein
MRENKKKDDGPSGIWETEQIIGNQIPLCFYSIRFGII